MIEWEYNWREARTWRLAEGAKVGMRMPEGY